MAIIRGPVHFDMGSPPEERGRVPGEDLARVTMPYSFAVSVHEVTMQQFRRFKPDAQFAREVGEELDCPANRIDFHSAVSYCRWLSEQEGVPADQMCYDALTDDDPAERDGSLPDERIRRLGFRLLTEPEWEYVCRADSSTPWFCGISEEHLKKFGWFALNGGERVQPVGALLPNSRGLFDTAGNVGEWCHTISRVQGKYALRGGDYNDPSSMVRSAMRYLQSATGYSYTGFRIARTIASDL
jgi:formylglycine-generating enzyme required for sulfatase activity